ncbi:hypothetical protein N9049_00045 [bacterium]|nr:hypothetical protein [bacterium]
MPESNHQIEDANVNSFASPHGQSFNRRKFDDILAVSADRFYLQIFILAGEAFWFLTPVFDNTAKENLMGNKKTPTEQSAGVF